MSENTLARKQEKSILDSVNDRIEELSHQGGINFPPNYSVSNALRTAWLTIQETKDLQKRPALDVCTKDSVANALLYTVIQGLNPAKKQIYYIVYGNQLQAQRSYFGTMAVTKHVPGVKKIISDVIWNGDTFEVTKEAGSWKILKHESSIDNIGDGIEDIRAVYCTILLDEGESYTEIMNRKQIEKAWSKSRSKEHSVHKEFPDQMAKKTVIGRACKFFLNTSDDSDLIIEAFNATGEQYVNTSATPVQEENKRLESLNAEVQKKASIPVEAAQVEPVEETPLEMPEKEEVNHAGSIPTD
ncbi:MAG: recombinase RecT [Oscillospiraceae bacterium]|jgi:recombination protein RecT|nr:recombinase RecT [Oscillospiraceae bacterium]MCI2190693.1 recombinase RecT [Oscillospiraceae bacterium]